MEQTNANLNHRVGTAMVIAIKSTSGGIGKNEDSAKEIIAKAGSACGVADQ